MAEAEPDGAAKPADFSTAQLGEIWKGYWEAADAKIREPKLEKLSERQVIERMTGKWIVMFSVVPDRIAILLDTNRLVEVSGRKDGKDWKKTGEWRVISDKLVLFLKQDDLPSFIFKTRGRAFIFDPWATTMMSELKRQSDREGEQSGGANGRQPFGPDTNRTSAAAASRRSP